jgi:hypothetical protein
VQDFETALAAAFGTGPAAVPGLAIDRLDGPATGSAPVLGSVSPCLTGVNLGLAPAAG